MSSIVTNNLRNWQLCMTRFCATSFVLLVICASAAEAQLRIVSYNTSTGHNNSSGTGVKTARAEMDIVLESIGEESINGLSRPIDVLLLQEQFSMSQSAQSFVTLLNGIYGAGTYARGFINGATSEPNGDAGRPGIVYNTNTVELLEEVSFGVVNGSNQARSTLRYALRPVGYDSSADFYAYNDHYKAGNTASDQNRRNIEATSIRSDMDYGSNNLGEGAHAIFAGDYNMPSSSQTAFQTLIAAGAGQANDPLNRLGSWNNNVAFADIHTQAPCATGCGADQVGGGMDDRFDLQMVTGEFLDGEGLSYIGPTVAGMSGLTASYHTFGNNGTTFNTNINAASNTVAFPGVTSYTKMQILDALKTVSDHLPVVVDYQLPAVMQAVIGSVPATFDIGEVFNLDLTVSNDANVSVAIGADELDYSVSASGDVSGSFLDQMDLALGGGNMHLVGLDTSTPGLKSGTITITSMSQAVQNGLINIPISFEVLAAGLAGDYNGDGAVDAADYVVWRRDNGSPEGYDTWRENFGVTLPGGGGASPTSVPELGTFALVVMCICLAGVGRGRLKG